MNASERTQKWLLEHPEKAALNRAKQLAKRKEYRDDAITALSNAKYKTPLQAIKAYCRTICSAAICRKGANYHSAKVICILVECVFYPFRNGDPTAMQCSLKRQNLHPLK